MDTCSGHTHRPFLVDRGDIFCALFAWYAVQVHQTKYLIEAGFTPLVAAWSLGIVSIVAIPGQIGLGALSDRVGREWVWNRRVWWFRDLLWRVDGH